MEVERRVVIKELEIIILKEHLGRIMNGYMTRIAIYKKFGVSISSGTIYPKLRYLETKGLLRSFIKNGKRYYCLSPKGEARIILVNRIHQRIMR